MKKSTLFLLFSLLSIFLNSASSRSIRLQFQPDFPIDSIRIDNLDNFSSHTFMGGDALHFFFAAPTSVVTPLAASYNLRVLSSPVRDAAHIVFNQPGTGLVTCEVFTLQGRSVGVLSKILDAGTQRFTFVPDARGVYLVRVTTSMAVLSSKFISYGAAATAQLRYAGMQNTTNESTLELLTPAAQRISTSETTELVIRQNDLLRINCFSGTKVQTVYDYATSDKNYILRFTDRYHQFQLYNIVASKPGFVDVMYAVTDASNRGVDDLNNLDFVLREDDAGISASESFRHVQKVNQIPFEIKTVLMIDNSISIVNDLELVKQAALKFVRKVRANQQIAVYVFSDVPTLLQDFTNDTLKLQTAINKIAPGYPSTNLYGSLLTGLSRWTDQFTLTRLTQGSLIAFTDGNDTQGSSTLSQVLAARGSKKVYIIGLGNEITPSVLNQISYPSGYISILKAGQLEETFNQIQADIVRYSNSFYWLNYMSPKRSGTHTLAVSTSGNTNLTATGVASGSFSASGFQSVNSGVFLNISDSKFYGIDSVFCFYDQYSYNFTNARYGAIVSKDSLVLKPTTYWAFKQPVYNWTITDTPHFDLKSLIYTSRALKAMGGDTIKATITVSDQANNYTKQIAVQMHPEKPLFSMLTIDSITGQTAQIKGAVLNEGRLPVLAKGLVWSTYQNPTIALSTKTSDGSGIGSFVSSLSGLQPGAIYYVRAYAIISVGTAYGNEISFCTYKDGEVYNPATGKVWMDRNLGASRVATSSTDAESYGDLYQWGRSADGHEKRTSQTTFTLSSSDTPSHGEFITSSSDWRSPQNNNLWQGVNGINNPCPEGFRIPTMAELTAEQASWSSNNSAGAFASPLKLPLAGYRSYSYGTLSGIGSLGFYWSATVYGTYAQDLSFDSGYAGTYSFVRANGFSVRCLKDN